MGLAAMHQVPPGSEGGLREDESIPVDPLGVLGVESHEPIEKDVGDGCHAPRCRSAQSAFRDRRHRSSSMRGLHRGTRVARVGVEGGIGLDTERCQQLRIFFLSLVFFLFAFTALRYEGGREAGSRRPRPAIDHGGARGSASAFRRGRGMCFFFFCFFFC